VRGGDIVECLKIDESVFKECLSAWEPLRCNCRQKVSITFACNMLLVDVVAVGEVDRPRNFNHVFLRYLPMPLKRIRVDLWSSKAGPTTLS
jgi:hypothetical protein